MIIIKFMPRYVRRPFFFLCCLLSLLLVSCNFKMPPTEQDWYKKNITEHKFISYTAHIKLWSSIQKDTINIDEHVALEKVPTDTLLKGRVFISNLYGEGYYDGQDVYYHPQDSLLIEKHLINEQGIYVIMGNISARGILFDFLDTTSWAFANNYASISTLNGSLLTDTFFVKDTISGIQKVVTYIFKKNSKFPFKISTKSISEGITYIKELSIKDVRYDEDIAKYYERLKAKGYPIILKHPNDQVLSLPNGVKPGPIEGIDIQTNKPFYTAGMDGKVVLIDFWFIGCRGCMDAIPYLNKIRKKYPADKVAIIGVDASDTNIDGIRKFVEEKNIKYTIVSSPAALTSKYSVNAFPTLYILDKSGMIIDSEVGFNEKEFEKKVSEIIDSHL
jgi:thiol-disulfide isomerase/thioredoxin